MLCLGLVLSSQKIYCCFKIHFYWLTLSAKCNFRMFATQKSVDCFKSAPFVMIVHGKSIFGRPPGCHMTDCGHTPWFCSGGFEFDEGSSTQKIINILKSVDIEL